VLATIDSIGYVPKCNALDMFSLLAGMPDKNINNDVKIYILRYGEICLARISI
jgi:hypothetical protein